MITLNEMRNYHLILSGLFVTLCCPQAAAITIEQPVWNEVGIQIQYYEPLGQSFTAEGHELLTTAFRYFAINPAVANNPVSLKVRAGDGLGGEVLGSTWVLLPPPGGPFNVFGQWIESDWSELDIAMTPGERYTLELDASSQYAGVYGSSGDSYPGGAVFRGPTEGALGDLAFVVQFGGGNAVPESGSALQLLSLVFAGLMLVGKGLIRPRNRELAGGPTTRPAPAWLWASMRPMPWRGRD